MKFKAARAVGVLGSLMLACGSAHAGNYAGCILDNMPGVMNSQAAFAVQRSCAADFPRKYTGIYKGSSRGLFGYSSSEECIVKKSRDTAQPNAAFMIAQACRCLYDEALVEKQLCEEP